MNINEILKVLRAEREELERAIASLYRLRGGRGRRPKWLNNIGKTKQEKSQSKKAKN